MKRRIISILLMISMVFTIIPVQVFAGEPDIMENSKVFSVEVNETTFPDQMFRMYVTRDILNGGNILTEEAIEMTTSIIVDCWEIQNLTGIEYFSNLKILDCSTNALKELPELPEGLEELYCQENELTLLPALPGSLKKLKCSSNLLSELPELPETLTHLECSYNKLTEVKLNENAEYECIMLERNYLEDISYISGQNEFPWDTDEKFRFFPQNSIHNYGDAMDITDPTCTEKGFVTRTCLDCGKIKVEEEIDALGHNWIEVIELEATCFTDGKAYSYCDRCKELNPDGERIIPACHVWNEGIIIEDGNCIKTGLLEYTCTKCGNTKTEEMSDYNHLWNEYYTMDKEPSITKAGRESIHCSICDEKKEDSIRDIPPYNHCWNQDSDESMAGFKFDIHLAPDFFDFHEAASVSSADLCQGMRFNIFYQFEDGSMYYIDYEKLNGDIPFYIVPQNEEYYSESYYKLREGIKPGTYKMRYVDDLYEIDEELTVTVFSTSKLQYEMAYMLDDGQWGFLDAKNIQTDGNVFDYVEGDKLQLTIRGKGFLNSDPISVWLDPIASAEWKSTNPEVATVDNAGCVTFTGVGSTNIIYSYEGNTIERTIYVYDAGVYMTKYTDVSRMTVGKGFEPEWTVSVTGDVAAAPFYDISSSARLFMIFDDETIRALEEKELLGETTMNGFKAGTGYHSVWALKGTGGCAPLQFAYHELEDMTLTGYLVIPNNKCTHALGEEQVMFESCDCYLNEDKLCDIQVTNPDGSVEVMKKVPFTIEVLKDTTLNNRRIIADIKDFYNKNNYLTLNQRFYLEELLHQIIYGFSAISEGEEWFYLPVFDSDELTEIGELMQNTILESIEYYVSEGVEIDNLYCCTQVIGEGGSIYIDPTQKISFDMEENHNIGNTTEELINSNQEIVSSYDLNITRVSEGEEGEEIVEITETPTELGITIDTGENLEDVDVTLIREHKDPETGIVKAEVIDCETDGTKVKFKSDKFSHYTIVKSEKCEHEWDEGTVIKSATCINKGKMLYTCSKCDRTKNEDIPREKHTPSKTYTFHSLPDCTTGASLRLYCEYGCGYEFEDSRIETHPLGHNYKNKLTPATVTADGKLESKCTRCGDVEKTTKIYKASSVSLSTSTYTYNGSVKAPSVTVKNSKGTILKKDVDYSVKYASGRKNVGKYAVTVTLKGNYKGTITKYLTINPKATSLSSLSKASKAFTAKWKKQSTQVTGYQIQYSTSKKFAGAKTVTVSSYKTTSKKITKLSKKKTYYVRIRTYKTVGKTKFYSGWSAAKSVKTK